MSGLRFSRSAAFLDLQHSQVSPYKQRHARLVLITSPAPDRAAIQAQLSAQVFIRGAAVWGDSQQLHPFFYDLGDFRLGHVLEGL